MHAKVKISGRSITRLHVSVIRASAQMGVLRLGTQVIACAIGRTGISARKREGDGASPRGSHAIVGGYYRPDQFRVRPRTAIALRPLRRDDGWCDAAGHASYNRPVRLPFAASHELLWRDDALYDVVLVLDYNLTRRSRGRGSAIFVHLARPDFGPTAGCLSMTRRNLLMLLARIGPRTRVTFG